MKQQKSVLTIPSEHAIGDLVYLSGDIGRSKKRDDKKKKKKDDRKTKRDDRKASGGGKVKRTLKRVAKVGLIPARGAFLAIVTLNVAKLATKLARVWNKPNGKEELTKFWSGKFQGDMEKLKTAISKGSKTQVASLGVAIEVAAATALPIVIGIVPIIKAFKAEGDEAEGKGFASFVKGAFDKLKNDPDFAKGDVQMPEGTDVADLKTEPVPEEGNNTMLIVAAAGAAAYLLTRK